MVADDVLVYAGNHGECTLYWGVNVQFKLLIELYLITFWFNDFTDIAVSAALSLQHCHAVAGNLSASFQVLRSLAQAKHLLLCCMLLASHACLL